MARKLARKLTLWVVGTRNANKMSSGEARGASAAEESVRAGEGSAVEIPDLGTVMSPVDIDTVGTIQVCFFDCSLLFSVNIYSESEFIVHKLRPRSKVKHVTHSTLFQSHPLA